MVWLLRVLSRLCCLVGSRVDVGVGSGGGGVAGACNGDGEGDGGGNDACLWRPPCSPPYLGSYQFVTTSTPRPTDDMLTEHLQNARAHPIPC